MTDRAKIALVLLDEERKCRCDIIDAERRGWLDLLTITSMIYTMWRNARQVAEQKSTLVEGKATTPRPVNMVNPNTTATVLPTTSIPSPQLLATATSPLVGGKVATTTTATKPNLNPYQNYDYSVCIVCI